jgi:hypothetical protein
MSDDFISLFAYANYRADLMVVARAWLGGHYDVRRGDTVDVDSFAMNFARAHDLHHMEARRVLTRCVLELGAWPLGSVR